MPESAPVSTAVPVPVLVPVPVPLPPVPVPPPPPPPPPLTVVPAVQSDPGKRPEVTFAVRMAWPPAGTLTPELGIGTTCPLKRSWEGETCIQRLTLQFCIVISFRTVTTWVRVWVPDVASLWTCSTACLPAFWGAT
jgi:hypothetical protein